MKLTRYPLDSDSKPLNVDVAVVTDLSGNGGNRAPIVFGPDDAPLDAHALLMVDADGNPISLASFSVATRSALAGLNTTAVKAAYLREAGREGNFVWDASDLSAKVTADPNQGLYVAPTGAPTGSGGAWVRKFSGAVNVKWFGALGDGATNDGSAFIAALALLKAIAVNQDNFYQGSPALFIPTGHYYLGANTLDISHTLIIEGESGVGGGISTLLRWAANTTGIRIQAYNTSGDANVIAPGFNAGTGTILKNISLRGGYAGGAEGEYHGIHARTRIVLNNFWIDKFAGDGIHATTGVGGGGALEGNSNNSIVRNGRITEVRNGIYLDGSDANVWTVESVDLTYSRQWAVWDSSFLGNTFITVHSANAAIVANSPFATLVSNGTNRYYVKPGQAVGASTNAPAAGAADNTWWAYFSAGGQDLTLNIPTWANGIAVREGGGFKTDNLNAKSQFIGCYSEGGQPPSQIISPSLILGGLMATGNIGDAPLYDGGPFAITTSKPSVLGQTRIAFGAGATNPSLTIHNDAALSGNLVAKINFCQGYENDGVTPLNLASIYSFPNTGPPNSTVANLYFAVRTFGGTGGMTDMMVIDNINGTVRPATTNVLDFGTTGLRWKKIWGVSLDISGAANIQGLLTTKASAAGGAGVILPHGAAPTSPNDGDIWTTTAGLFVRINGSTIGPLAPSGAAPVIAWKDPVRVATTANGALATAYENGDTVDGVVLVTGDRILLKNQTTGSENGIYTVNASGAPTRSTDADAGSELVGAAVWVSEGTANADSTWVCTTNAPITVGSTSLVFAQPSVATAPTGTNNNQPASTAFVQQELAASAVQSVWIPASAMKPRTSNPPATGTTETTTNKVNLDTLDFDGTANEFAQFDWLMPKRWNEGTLTTTFVWTAPGGTGNVVWGIQAVAISDDDLLDSAFGTAQTVTDGVTAITDLMRSAATAAMTVGGSPANSDLVKFQVYRDAANGSDTLNAIDAKLIGVEILITTNARDDS